MGNYSFGQRESSPVSKCPKTENSCDVNKTSCIESHQTCSSYHQTCSQRWECLPYVALVEIYKHLSNTDKANMGMTCKSWLLPFTRPALWRRGNFRFDGYGDQRALQYVALMGSALRHVVVDCSASKDKVTSRAKSSSVKLCLFLTTLISADNRKLETVCVRHLCRLFRYWIHQRNNDELNMELNPLEKLTTVVEVQERLRRLDVTNAGVLVDQAIRLLESVKYPCYVEQLSISEVVAQFERYLLSGNPRFIHAMASYTCLNELRLSEEYISHQLLMTLTGSTALTLRLLEVNVLYKIRRHPNEGMEHSWEIFCNAMTHLKISFVVKGVFASREVVRVLPSTVRLYRLEWELGNSIIDFKMFFLHLIKFREFLQYLRITVYFAIESDVAVLAYTLQRLPNLRILHINSPIIAPLLLYQLEKSLRRCLTTGPPGDRVLQDVFINGTRLDPTETWYSYFAGLIMQQTLHWQSEIRLLERRFYI